MQSCRDTCTASGIRLPGSTFRQPFIRSVTLGKSLAFSVLWVCKMGIIISHLFHRVFFLANICEVFRIAPDIQLSTQFMFVLIILETKITQFWNKRQKICWIAQKPGSYLGLFLDVPALDRKVEGVRLRDVEDKSIPTRVILEEFQQQRKEDKREEIFEWVTEKFPELKKIDVIRIEKIRGKIDKHTIIKCQGEKFLKSVNKKKDQRFQCT